MSSYISKRSKKENNRCSICNRVISNERHARCFKCPYFIQCLQCLSVGQEYDNHYYKHPCFIVEPRPYPIFCQNWDVHDEILLLTGIKLFGIGNWNEIANYMKTKTALDIETHYIEIYINSPNAPFPLPEVLPQVPKPPPPPYETKPVESCPSEAHEKHMNEKNKKEKTVPAEFNGYMPYRHEFELDFNNDAENLVAKVEFKADDSKQSFMTKISYLTAYNSVLAERRFRTKVVEDWNIHHKVVKTTKTEKDIDPRFLGGFTPEERIVDSKIISLAPYLGYQKMQLWANSIHKKVKILNKIKQRKQWMQYGIHSLDEGNHFSQLQSLIKEGKNQVVSDVETWNELIAKYNRSTEKVAVKNKNSLMSQELQLCQKEKINPQLYSAMKCALIREGALRPLDKQDAISIDPHHANTISKIFDLLVSLGIIRAL